MLKRWLEWWFLIPFYLGLAIGSYWFVPFILKSLGMPEQDMSYTGTAWIYDWVKSWLIFFGGIGITFLGYKLFYALIHKYHESQEFDNDFNDRPKGYKVTVSFLIPAFMLLCYCLCVIAVF